MEAYKQMLLLSLKVNFEKLKTTIFFELSLLSDTSIYIVYLKAYANHLKGVQVMETISLQCNSLYQIHSSVYFRLKIARQVEHTWEKC